MRRIIFTIFMAIVAAGFMAHAKTSESKTSPQIQFTTNVHDFGSIKEKGGAARCEFEFTNRGTAPLVIVSVTASCGCTRPVFPTEPIQPGKKGVIKVTFLPEGHPGEINKVIKVRTNDPSNKRVQLKLKGYVLPAAKK